MITDMAAPQIAPLRKVGPFWTGLAVVVVIIGLVAYAAHQRSAKAAAGHQVVYTVTTSVGNTGADDTANLIDYVTAGGQQQAAQTSIPWTYSADLKAKDGTGQLYVSGQRAANDAGNITCQISIDGTVVSSNVSSGPYSIVTCSAPLS